MSEHTPGPWRIEDGTRIMPPDNATQLPIAKMGKLQHESKIEPNARLIAAAPELLEACKDLLAFMEQYDLLDWDLADDDRARIDAARAAIAKATGASDTSE